MNPYNHNPFTSCNARDTRSEYVANRQLGNNGLDQSRNHNNSTAHLQSVGLGCYRVLPAIESDEV